MLRSKIRVDDLQNHRNQRSVSDVLPESVWHVILKGGDEITVQRILIGIPIGFKIKGAV